MIEIIGWEGYSGTPSQVTINTPIKISMKNTILLLLFLLPLLQACSEHHGTPGAVELDQGKRWQANPETTAGIAAMQTILTKYEGQTTDAAGRKALRDELETAFQDIFKQCTMKGKAHDQLHNYLLPMKNLMEKITSETAGESELAFDQLKKHLAEYPTYFE